LYLVHAECDSRIFNLRSTFEKVDLFWSVLPLE